MGNTTTNTNNRVDQIHSILEKSAMDSPLEISQKSTNNYRSLLLQTDIKYDLLLNKFEQIELNRQLIYLEEPSLSENDRYIVDIMVGADANDAESQYKFAVCLLTGMYGIEQDELEGIRWLKIAASKNHSNSLHRLAMHIIHNKDIFNYSQNKAYDVATTLFFKAALLNNYQSAHNLNIMHKYGYGLDKVIPFNS
jgi:hypothetical protein